MSRLSYKIRRLSLVLALLGGAAAWLIINPESYETVFHQVEALGDEFDLSSIDLSAIDLGNFDFNKNPTAKMVLEKIAVKGRAPKTNYSREEFYGDWPTVDGCNLRQKIIKREFGDSAVLDGCIVLSGEYEEPYTGVVKKYTSRDEISSGIQIDHVVALSDAWQKGAQNLTKEQRYEIATDPLNLVAVDSKANQSKSDADAASWLPSNKKFRCQYVARQVSVKYKYGLWVTEAEYDAILEVLKNCPNELAVGISL